MRGKGIAVRAATLICAYGFQSMGLRRIEGFTLPDNEGSGKVLVKVGFQFEALLRSRVTRQNGEQSDSRLYSLIP
jgi:RimJ/RimL family protein N-acetyltransferase